MFNTHLHAEMSTGSPSPINMIQAGRADVLMSSCNCSTIPDEQLHVNSRRCWSSTSAVRQSAEVDCPMLLTNIFSRLCFAVAAPSTWNSLPDSLHDQELSEKTSILKTYFFSEILTPRHIERIIDFFE